MKRQKGRQLFVVEDESSQFQCTPLGLKEAFGEFKRLMNMVFRDLKENGVIKL